MRRIDLATAAGHIKQVCDENRETGGRLPFFFLVGSGLSYPQVPLAADIEADCKATSHEQKRKAEPAGKRMIDTYSHWFDQAHPHPIERQRYLRKLIEGKNISHANFRLAHLLLEKRLANLVVTTNFDDFLSRALTLFGKPHIVCDHPRTVERIDPEADDIQVVHVHGTYWFYDCCNLVGEIEERSRSSAENSLTMASLLDTLLSRRSPLVVGYGGWEGDVVMSALKRRLQNRLPYNLYWFCYRESEAAAVREQLGDHPDVYYVVAGRSPAEGAATDGSAAPVTAVPPPAAETSDSDDMKQVLEAQKVFDELIRVFDLATPQLTHDPLGYFAEYLKGSLPPPEGKSSEIDIYSLKIVIEGIESARGRQTKGRKSRLQQIRDRLLRSDFRGAIRLGEAMAAGKLPVRETRDLLRTMLTAAWRLDDSSAEEIQGYDLVIRLGASISSHDTFVRERVSMAMVNKGLALAGANRHPEAIKAFDEAARRFAKERELFFRQQVAEAMFNKGFSLSAMGRHEQAIQAYAKLIRLLHKTTDPELQESVAMALLNQGSAWSERNDSKEELACYDEVVKRFSASEYNDVLVQVARALYNKGATLMSLSRTKGAAQAFQEIIKRYESSRVRELRELVADARNALEEDTAGDET